MYIYIYMLLYIYIYIYIDIERERTSIVVGIFRGPLFRGLLVISLYMIIVAI